MNHIPIECVNLIDPIINMAIPIESNNGSPPDGIYPLASSRDGCSPRKVPIDMMIKQSPSMFIKYFISIPIGDLLLWNYIDGCVHFDTCIYTDLQSTISPNLINF